MFIVHRQPSPLVRPPRKPLPPKPFPAWGKARLAAAVLPFPDMLEQEHWLEHGRAGAGAGAREMARAKKPTDVGLASPLPYTRRCGFSDVDDQLLFVL
jgi:hypothetical protein